jgi:hypothetical protein
MTMSNAESSATNIEDDLNYIRTQLKDINGTTNWYDTPPTTVTALYNKTFSRWLQHQTAVTVGSDENFVLLTGTGKPLGNMAITNSSMGVIVSQLSGAIGEHDLTKRSDLGNVIEIREAGTNDILYTSGATPQQIYGLLQVGSDATDGNAFGDTSSDDQAQISFVYINPDTEAYTAVPVADIEDKSIEYAYHERRRLIDMPENSFDPSITFVESVALSTVDLQDAYNNSSTGTITLSTAKNLSVDMNGNANFEVKNSSTSYIQADVTNTVVKFGVDAEIRGANELRFYNASNSFYTSFNAPALSSSISYILPISDGASGLGYSLTTDGAGNLSWSNKGEFSKKATYVVSSPINSDTAINLSSFTNPDSLVLPSTGADFVKHFDVYVNGVLNLNGASISQGNDVYWITTATFAFTYPVNPGDVIQIIQRRN